MNARDDESHLIFGAAQGRVLVSANVRDFASLHRERVESDGSPCGILIIPQQRYTTGEIVRRVLRVVSSKFDLTNGLFYLSNF
jgi:hypothetical protein